MPSLIKRSLFSRAVKAMADALHVPGPQDLFRMFAARARTRRKRAQIAALLKQDAFVLDDIGVTHDDVRAALSQPGDAALNLRRQARARRDAWVTRRPL